MNKAFTKESDNQDEDGDSEVPEPSTPGNKNYITPTGAERLRNELKMLLHDARPEIVKTISWAASNGDRSENGDYIYGKRKLREIDRRIRFLNRRLDRIEIVDPAKQGGDTVLFGARVTTKDEEDNVREYTIVGIDETDVRRGHISWISPIGKAMLGAKKGDVVVLRTPRGEEDLEIIKVHYGEV